MVKLSILFIFIFFQFGCFSQNDSVVRQDTAKQKLSDSLLDDFEEKDSVVSFLFIGDIMGHDSQINAAYNADSGRYIYDGYFTYLKEILSEPDFTIANLEVTLAGPPFKGYPQFSSPEALALACKDAGMDVLVTANNHSCDRGKDGVIRTVEMLDSLDIIHTGTFKDSADMKKNHPLILEKSGIKLALLNYTYGTNGIPVRAPSIVNLIDKEKIAQDIDSAKALNPDKILLFVHWGTEYLSLPTEKQKNLTKFFFERGADIVIGSHPHVIEPLEWQKDSITGKETFVAYSMGNFVSNQRKRKTDGGMMVYLELAKNDSACFINDAGYYLTWVYKPVVDGKKTFTILPASKYEDQGEFFQTIISKDKMALYLKDSRKLMKDHTKNVNEIKIQSDTLINSENEE